MALQCHSEPDLAAFHEGCAFNVPPNGKLCEKTLGRLTF